MTPPFSFIWVDQFSLSFIVTPRSFEDFSCTMVFPPTDISTGESDLWFRIISVVFEGLATSPFDAMNLRTWLASSSSLNFTSSIVFPVTLLLVSSAYVYADECFSHDTAAKHFAKKCGKIVTWKIIKSRKFSRLVF